jgi:hypothetical protein
LYDDFFGDLWQRGKLAATTFWKNNKETIYDLLKTAITTLAPVVLGSNSNQLKSEDPYAIDT